MLSKFPQRQPDSHQRNNRRLKQIHSHESEIHHRRQKTRAGVDVPATDDDWPARNKRNAERPTADWEGEVHSDCYE